MLQLLPNKMFNAFRHGLCFPLGLEKVGVKPSVVSCVTLPFLEDLKLPSLPVEVTLLTYEGSVILLFGVPLLLHGVIHMRNIFVHIWVVSRTKSHGLPFLQPLHQGFGWNL